MDSQEITVQYHSVHPTLPAQSCNVRASRVCQLMKKSAELLDCSSESIKSVDGVFSLIPMSDTELNTVEPSTRWLEGGTTKTLFGKNSSWLSSLHCCKGLFSQGCALSKLCTRSCHEPRPRSGEPQVGDPSITNRGIVVNSDLRRDDHRDLKSADCTV
jgi:hypothetical protein